jgi:hypothetical protein
MKLSLLIVSLLMSSYLWASETRCSQAYANNTMSYPEFDRCLNANGVMLEVHGIVPMSSMFVVTFRNPQNFFQSVHLSLIGLSQQTRTFIQSLRRHDVVLVKGYINDLIESPQVHIMAEAIELLERNPDSPSSGEYTYEALPQEILQGTSLVGKVHAIYAEGKVLVVEYKDFVIPVFVEAQYTQATKDLFRGDIITLEYVVQQGPRRPVHLNFNPARGAGALRVTRSVVAAHGTPVKMTGKLLMFPKSPMVKFPVFAIDVDMGNGVYLPHTIISFTDPELFRQARELLQAAWDRHPGSVRNFRNKFINDALNVTVQGTYNMIDAGQANPQIIIDSLDAIEVSEQ